MMDMLNNCLYFYEFIMPAIKYAFNIYWKQRPSVQGDAENARKGNSRLVNEEEESL